MNDLKQIVAKNIMNLRTQNKMTQLELGEKLSYSDKAISKWERGESIPDAYVLKQISEMFGVTVDYLLNDNGDDAKDIPKKHHHNNRMVITKITIVSIWTVAIFIFIIVYLAGYLQWMILAYTMPVSLITLLVLNSIWGKLKNNFFIISAIEWSILLCLYLSFLIFANHNWWQLFVLGVPVEIIIYLCFKIRLKKKP